MFRCKMRKYAIGFAVAALIFLLILLVAAWSVPSDEGTLWDRLFQRAVTPFSCYTLDGQGNELYGYHSEHEDVWYLFLPSELSVADTQLHYTGEISESSCGILDEESKTISGAFAESGDQVILTGVDGDHCTVAVLQSELPSLSLRLQGTTLAELHQDKSVKYGSSFRLTGPDGTDKANGESAVTIKGRGNSSWTMFGDKKGYQIEFDRKVSLLGMEKAKKWILLANASDLSMIRTQLVYRMAEEMDMGFVPDFEYVDLWIDGEYRGTYMLGEKVEIGSSRLALSNSMGLLYEQDEAFYEQEDSCFYSQVLNKHFVLIDTVEKDENTISAARADFEAAVDRFSAFLYSGKIQDITLENLSKMIDVDSFIKYYIINEYVLNREGFASSFYWYKDGPGDVLHLGPIWDFDTCMGNDGTAYTEYYGITHTVFRFLLANQAFFDRAQELYERYEDRLHAMTDDAELLREEIAVSAEMNYIRWEEMLGMKNPKGENFFENSFDEAVDAVQAWLSGRAAAFKLQQTDLSHYSPVTSVVSEGCKEMELSFDDEGGYSQLCFMVWSLEDGQDDMNRYDAERGSDGLWHSTVDLSLHDSAGVYSIFAYPDGESWVAGWGYSYVEVAVESLYRLSAQVSEDCKTMEITLADSSLCGQVVLAVWSEEDSQDDIRWYAPERGQDGLWHSSVDLREHHSSGRYFIHAFSAEGEELTLIAEKTAQVAFAVY